jgi:hypothetical protein
MSSRKRRGETVLVEQGALPALVSDTTTRAVHADPAAAPTTGTGAAALQSAAALETLLVSTYTTVLGLDVISGGNTSLLELLTATLGQHADHAAAFNTAAVAAGGAPQVQPNAAHLAQVRAAEPGLATAADVVALVGSLEDLAARTYTADALQAAQPALRLLFVSVAGVEAAHHAVLDTLGALLAVGLSADIPLGPALAALPAAIGSSGLPVAALTTTGAVPTTEGSLP